MLLHRLEMLHPGAAAKGCRGRKGSPRKSSKSYEDDVRVSMEIWTMSSLRLRIGLLML
jgi:hypothetical protein